MEETKMERCEAAERVLGDIYAAFEQGDPSLFERHLMPGDETVVIGTDPGEWWQGAGDVVRAVGAQIPEMKEAGIEVQRGEMRAFSEGSVAWLTDKPSFKLADGTTIPLRVTAVLLNDGKDWKLAQWHGSVGASNEEVVGTEMTT
jgi:hypothetical protein